jgi:hypothetical protein
VEDADVMASVFKRKGVGSWLISYYDQAGRRKEKSSRTTDFRAAERIAQKIEADVALRRDGVVDARHERLTEENKKPLAQQRARIPPALPRSRGCSEGCGMQGEHPQVDHVGDASFAPQRLHAGVR